MAELPAFDLDVFRCQVGWLADHGVFLGTSSWNYEGWLGQLYERERYETHGRFSSAKFSRECLQEYAETFRTVCFDGGYYAFPAEKSLRGMSAQVRDNFRFGFKVTDEITKKHFPKVPTYGKRAGLANGNYLDAALFLEKFLKPTQDVLGPKLGPIMFEFSKMSAADYGSGSLFVSDLDRFFSCLPKGPRYSVELRNRAWLGPEYLGCLRKHGVAHVLNSWTDMPPVSEQIPLVGDLRGETSTVARFLLKPGRAYQQAVDLFKPYQTVKEPNPDAGKALEKLVREGILTPRGDGTYIYINNRLEGNAIGTVESLIKLVKQLIPLEVSQPKAPKLPRKIPVKPAAQLDLGL